MKLHMAHIGPRTGADHECQGHIPVGLIDRGHRLHVGKGIAILAELVLDAILAGGDLLAGKHLPRLDLGCGHELVGGQDQFTGQIHGGHLVDLPFIHVDTDVDIALVRRQRDLGGANVELDVASILVVGVQRFQIPGQGLSGIAILHAQVTGHEGIPTGHRKAQGTAELAVREDMVAHDVDHANLGRLALLDGNCDTHPVVRQIFHLGGDVHAILAIGKILAPQLLFHLVEHRAVEKAPLGKPHLTQALGQILGLDVLVAGDGKLGDGRALLDPDQHGAPFPVHSHIREESRAIQGAQGLCDARRRQYIAGTHRQIIECRALLDPGEPLESDTAHHEGCFLVLACGHLGHHLQGSGGQDKQASRCAQEGFRPATGPAPRLDHLALHKLPLCLLPTLAILSYPHAGFSGKKA